MRKNFGAKTIVFPMPVFIIAAYGEDGKANAMNAAWGGISEENEISICLSASHKTTKNIELSGAFTVSMATADTVKSCDYVGIVSGNDTQDKMEKANFHTRKSDFVNAPIIEELPMTVECKLIKFNEDGICVGEIVNVSADESVLDEKGKVDPEKLHALMFDQFQNGYYVTGEKVGKAWNAGAALMKK